MLQELAYVESVHVPKELCLSFLKLLTQRDYLIQSALIMTKCFQLVYTGTELENLKLPKIHATGLEGWGLGEGKERGDAVDQRIVIVVPSIHWKKSSLSCRLIFCLQLKMTS